MDNIAKLSDVSTKTLYNLFTSRELLLLEAASERLLSLGQSEEVMGAEPGLPRLLAFRVGALSQFEAMPDTARVLISILMRLDSDDADSNARFGPVQRYAEQCLSLAATQGELRPGLNLGEVACLFAANQWGLVLLWEKGLLPLGRMEAQVSLDHHLTLMPLCIGERKRKMETALETLLESMAQRESEPESSLKEVFSGGK